VRKYFFGWLYETDEFANMMSYFIDTTATQIRPEKVSIAQLERHKAKFIMII